MTESAQRRTLQKVRSDSRQAGTFEHAFWTPTNGDERARALEAARRYDVIHKRKGRRNGPLGHVSLEILAELWRVVDYGTGRLEPSYDWIGGRIGRCRASVAAGLKRLAREGFLTKVRRFEPTGGPRGVRGPQVAQATNAYRLDIPALAAALLPRRRERTAPRGLTRDELRLARDQMAAAKLQASLAAGRPFRWDHYRDEAAGTCPPSLFAKALKMLEASSRYCESAIPSESGSRFILRGEGAAVPRHAGAAIAAK